LAAQADADYLLADTGTAMAQAILDLARDPIQCARVAAAGRELVQRRYDWAALGDELAARLFEIVRP
jgi:glycosyltransferase involved in cell wall biosynthesis